MKRIVSFILVLFMVFSVSDVAVYAKGESEVSNVFLTEDEIKANPLMYSLDVQKEVEILHASSKSSNFLMGAESQSENGPFSGITPKSNVVNIKLGEEIRAKDLLNGLENYDNYSVTFDGGTDKLVMTSGKSGSSISVLVIVTTPTGQSCTFTIKLVLQNGDSPANAEGKDSYVTLDEINDNPLMYNIAAQKRIAVFLDYMESEYVIKKRDIYVIEDAGSEAKKQTISYMDWDAMIKNSETMKKERKNQIGKTYTVGKAKYKIIAYNQARRLQDLSKDTTVVVPDTIVVGSNTYMVSELSFGAFNDNVTNITIGKYIQFVNNCFASLSKLKKVNSNSKHFIDRAYFSDIPLNRQTIGAWETTLYNNMKKSGKPVKSNLLRRESTSNKLVPFLFQKYQGSIKTNLDGKTILSSGSYLPKEMIIRLGKKCTDDISEFDYKKYDYYYTNAWNGGIVELPKKITYYVELDESGKETKSLYEAPLGGLKEEDFSIWYPKKDGTYTYRRDEAAGLEGYFKGNYAPANLMTKFKLMFKYRTPNVTINWDTIEVISAEWGYYSFNVDYEIYNSDWSKTKERNREKFSGDARDSAMSAF